MVERKPYFYVAKFVLFGSTKKRSFDLYPLPQIKVILPNRVNFEISLSLKRTSKSFLHGFKKDFPYIQNKLL